MSDMPFSIFKKQNSPFYYVRFKNLETGKYLAGCSTKQSTKKDAVAAAWKMYREAMAAPQGNSASLETKSFRQNLRKADISKDDLQFLLAECKRRGILSTYTLKNSRADVPAYEFMLSFWDWENSEYVAEKRRKSHRITKNHCMKQRGFVRNHWKDFLGGRLLGDLTRESIFEFVDKVAAGKDVSFSSKNDMIRAGTTALKWAANRGLIDNVVPDITFFSGRHKERKILTPELVQAVFSVEWNNGRAKLANILAMCTGLRSGEIRGLRLRDLGEDKIYVNHSWNDMEGLKCPKNGEARIVYVPFPQVIQKLREIGERNHFNQGLDAFVFESTIPSKPMEPKIFVAELRLALVAAGMSKESAKEYTFHSWRHFFTSYMSERVNQKVLQKQTGHKTLAMLEHYASHEIAGDVERLESAQIEAFGGFVEGLRGLKINYDRIEHDIRRDYKNLQG